MTQGTFCDLHPDANTSLIRGDKTHVYTMVLQATVKEIDKEGKKVSWTRETKLNGCPKCVDELILSRAKALGVELEYDEYRLTQENGKYKRINRSPEEAKATETPLAK